MGRKKKFIVETDEKYVDLKKHKMVTYIGLIEKAYDNQFLWRDIGLQKKLSDVDRKKKIVFSRR